MCSFFFFFSKFLRSFHKFPDFHFVDFLPLHFASFLWLEAHLDSHTPSRNTQLRLRKLRFSLDNLTCLTFFALYTFWEIIYLIRVWHGTEIKKYRKLFSQKFITGQRRQFQNFAASYSLRLGDENVFFYHFFYFFISEFPEQL